MLLGTHLLEQEGQVIYLVANKINMDLGHEVRAIVSIVEIANNLCLSIEEINRAITRLREIGFITKFERLEWSEKEFLIELSKDRI